MIKEYEKPIAMLLDFSIMDRIMDVSDYSENVGSDDEKGDYGD